LVGVRVDLAVGVYVLVAEFVGRKVFVGVNVMVGVLLGGEVTGGHQPAGRQSSSSNSPVLTGLGSWFEEPGAIA
jgi:hypothetical protein